MDMAPRTASIVIVDIERYSTRPDTVQADLRNDLYELVRGALTAADLDGETAIPSDRGDAIMMFFPTASPVHLLGPLVAGIDAALRRRNDRSSEKYQMRLRMAVHTGLIAQDANGWVGSAINDTARLIDAPAVRTGLSDNPDAALAVIIDDELHRKVISAGHESVVADEWAPARAVVKDFDRAVWVRVPGLRAAKPVEATPPAAAESSGPRPASAPVSAEPPIVAPGNIGNQVNGGTFNDTTIIGHDQHVYGTGR